MKEIKQAWQNTIFNAADKKIDLNKVMIKEVVYHDPFPNDETSEGMIVNYEYKGNVVGRYPVYCIQKNRENNFIRDTKSYKSFFDDG